MSHFSAIHGTSPMNIHRAYRSAILLLLWLMPAVLLAETFYVDSETGDDNASGTSQAEALRSSTGVSRLALGPGDNILFRRGQSFDGVLAIGANGTAANPISFSAWGSGAPAPVLYELSLSGDNLIFDGIDVDHRKDPSDAIRIRGARNVTIRNALLRNGARDAIDADQADGLLVEDVEIAYFLNGSFGSLDDSHGLAITSTDGVTLRRANIHHVSGDSLQVDPNRTPGAISDNIVIEDSQLWTGPLEEDFNAGWRQGDSPGENALDTKVLKTGFASEIRMNITLRNVTAYGWSAIPQMANRAAFNLKEKISATLDRITVYDSEIAFRIRGGLGNADTVISNAVIHDVETAIRSETSLTNLRVYNSTFGHGIGQNLQHAGGSGGTGSWDWRNNAFVGAKPAEASDSSNLAATSADFVDSGGRDYHLAGSSSLVNAGVSISMSSMDRDGTTRQEPFDVGAFELGSQSKKPRPPTLTID